MSVIVESPYIAALKKEYLAKYCSSCFHSASLSCPSCQSVVYCNDQCREKDRFVHQLECQMFVRRSVESGEDVLLRMLVRVISRLELDGGEPTVDLCENVPSSIRRRCWSDLLSHRDQLIHSERHRNLWLELNNQLRSSFEGQFGRFDLLEIFGQLLINRFRVGIHLDLREGRVAIGWAIYLTTSVFNHSCEPNLYQCSFDLQMRLKVNPRRLTSIPTLNSSFNGLTVSYRHQNDFHLDVDRSFVPMRDERRRFVLFFFFQCHCSWCDDEERNHREEFLSNRSCPRCGESLLLRRSHRELHQWLFVCSCDRGKDIVDRLILPFGENEEENLRLAASVFHRRSVFLNQIKENLFGHYQRQEKKNDQRRRATELGEELILFYDHYFQDSSIYPKIVLSDLIALHRSLGEDQRAKQLNDKLQRLWKEDYPQFNVQ